MQSRIEIAFGPCMQDMKLQPECLGRSLRVCRETLINGITGVDEQGNAARRGYDLVQQL